MTQVTNRSYIGSKIKVFSYIFSFRFVHVMGLWIPSSAELLLKAEEAVLRCVNSAYSLRDVCVNLTTKSVGLFRTRETTESYSIRTISFESESSHNNNQLPLVMIHGFASGLGLWVLNYDFLAPKVPLHALDLLGFASSSRNYPFSKDSQECIDSYVDSIEKWRQSLKLEKFVLLGHSFGAYLSYFYLLKYPQRVQHLILADPWGMKRFLVCSKSFCKCSFKTSFGQDLFFCSRKLSEKLGL